MNAPNKEEFDALEAGIEEQGVPVEELLRAYRDLLLKLIAEGRFKTIPSVDLDRISNHLRKSVELLLSKQEEERSKIRNALWSLADDHQQENPDLYHLARCAILTYGKVDEWNTAQDSPIFYCLLFLKRIIPEIEPEFVKHFQHILLHS